MEAALEAEHAEAALPENLAAKLREGVRLLREAADLNLTDEERAGALKDALKQLQTPPMIFLPHNVTRAAESARMLAGRALRQK
jgi:hypothetical protein